MRDWWYDDFRHVGDDYGDPETASQYDEKMHKLRNIPAEVDEMVRELRLTPDSEVIDFGCGTGLVTAGLAERCGHVTGVDISSAMLEYARAKSERDRITNAQWINGSILRFDYKPNSYDAAIMSLSLHHLPDFWKAVAFRHIHDMLKPGGKLWLFDVIYSFDMSRFEEEIDAWIAHVRKSTDNQGGSGKQFSDEYSTFDWIIDGLIERAGLKIADKKTMGGFLARYVSFKV